VDLGPDWPAVVLCPPLHPDRSHPAWVADLATSLEGAGIATLVLGPTDSGADVPGGGDPATVDDRLAVAGWVADQAIAITAARLSGPLLLVAHGAATRGVPALAMSQRAARHNVVGYVLVDGAPPQPGRAGQDWPDAPVLSVLSPSGDPATLRTARLRGWLTVHDEPARAVLCHVRTWPDAP
jgi:hypothetical protein